MTEPRRPEPRDPDELGFERIVYEKTPPRATITLNRPDVLNAFDFLMLREIARACEDASWDDGIRVVVVTGAGRAFCVGADLKSWSEDYLGKPGEYWKWFGAFKDMHDRLREVGKPTVARINGICVGGGNELAMACDLIVASESAQFGQPETGLGVMPGAGGTQLLARSIGKAKTMDVVLAGRFLDAHEAERAGLAARVVAREAWLEEAMHVASEIAGKAPAA